MKKQMISVIGIGALTSIGCGPIVNTNPPPQDNLAAIEQASPQPSALPKWEDVKAPNEGEKAELIVTESGCFKNWVAENPKDRFEEEGKGTKIECPERAQYITKEDVEKVLESPVHLQINPPVPIE